ncbi:MAG: pentapeptide repeat-containing protein [Proteobacteria bacterium]|nr:pentapeptide repeat-containing protein [Pseudomonadota bacterium]
MDIERTGTDLFIQGDSTEKMGEVTSQKCSFTGTVTDNTGKHSFDCKRIPYQDGLCIFHLPKSGKEELAPLFIDALKSEIEESTKSIDYVLDWQGADFPLTTLDGATFSQQVLLATARFPEGLTLRNCTFRGKVDFAKAIFGAGNKSLFLDKCHFLELASFWFAKFSAPITINRCTFDKEAIFQGCTLDSPDFSESTFSGTVGFVMTTFKNTSNFKLCNFKGSADFSAIVFDGTPRFDFRLASFGGKFVFGAYRDQIGPLSCEELDFSDVKLDEKSSLTFQYLEVGKIDFYQVRLDDVDLRFDNVKIGDGDFRKILSNSRATVSFIDTSLDNALFIDTNIEKFNFIGKTEWRNLYGRYALRSEDELLQTLDLIGPTTVLTEDQIKEINNKIETNSENYRQLVRNYELKRNFSVAEQFHIGEMEMQRRKSHIKRYERHGLTRSIMSFNDFALYRLLSRYGTNYMHSFYVLICGLLLLSLLFMVSGLKENEQRVSGGEEATTISYSLVFDADHMVSLRNWENLGRDYMHSLSFVLSTVTFQKNTTLKPSSLGGEFLRTFMLLIIPAQAALVLLSIRRKFKRSGAE